ncbi:hypothetical protein V6N13_099661 [Hibiscus sabdariffa]
MIDFTKQLQQKESLQIQNEAITLASISSLNTFLQLPKPYRITGTAATESAKCESRYKLKVEGVVDEVKRKLLNTCVVAWCKGTLRGAALVAELKMASFLGCSVMRIAGAAFLLIFSNDEDRCAVLD